MPHERQYNKVNIYMNHVSIGKLEMNHDTLTSKWWILFKQNFSGPSLISLWIILIAFTYGKYVV